MIYSFAITTPANTPAASAVKTSLALAVGIVHKLDLLFPPGCAGLLYVALRQGLHQVWPTNPDESFHTDGEAISFEEHYQLPPGESELTVVTYNLDDTYSHQVVVRLGVLQLDALRGIWLPWSKDSLNDEPLTGL